MAMKGVLRIPQGSSITEASPSDCLVSYAGHSLGKSYTSAEMLLVVSNAPAEWAIYGFKYSYLMLISVGYHPPFPHNELVHLPYIAVATNIRAD